MTRPPGRAAATMRSSAASRRSMCWSTPRACTRSKVPSGSGSSTMSCLRTSSPGTPSVWKRTSMSVARIEPPGATRVASQRASDPPPAPTSRQRQPGRTPSLSSRRCVGGSKTRPRIASRRRSSSTSRESSEMRYGPRGALTAREYTDGARRAGTGARDTARARRPSAGGEAAAELVLQDLARRVARDRVDELEAFGELLAHEAPRRQVLDHLLEEERVRGIAAGDHGAAALPELRVGEPDHRRVRDLWMRVEEVLDLLRRDVLALADDHVLEAPGDHHVAVRVDEAEVAAAEEAVGVEAVGVEARVEVAEAALRPADAELALLARPRAVTIGPHHRDLDSARGATLRVRELLVGVAHGVHRGDRALRHAPARHDPDAPELALHVEVELGWLRRAAARPGPRAREDRPPAALALRREVGLMEDGPRRPERDAVPREGIDALL